MFKTIFLKSCSLWHNTEK